ncbi:MAG TPA: hypothetical protein VMJ32_02400 [Pirellulales bacterium]|nr:hypothetical protein [Pirellulales bacterium]
MKSSGTVLRFETDGDTNVLDAISRVPGLSNLADARIKINRTDPRSLGTQVFDLTWADLSGGGIPMALLPRDRLCIEGAWYDPHADVAASSAGSTQNVVPTPFQLPQYPSTPAAPNALPQYAQPVPEGDYRPIPNYVPGGQSSTPIPKYSVPGQPVAPIPNKHIYVVPNNALHAQPIAPQAVPIPAAPDNSAKPEPTEKQDQ